MHLLNLGPKVRDREVRDSKYEGDSLCETFFIVDLKMERAMWQVIWTAPGLRVFPADIQQGSKDLNPETIRD